jgi:hypothetical protein
VNVIGNNSTVVSTNLFIYFYQYCFPGPRRNESRQSLRHKRYAFLVDHDNFVAGTWSFERGDFDADSEPLVVFVSAFGIFTRSRNIWCTDGLNRHQGCISM